MRKDFAYFVRCRYWIVLEPSYRRRGAAQGASAELHRSPV